WTDFEGQLDGLEVVLRDGQVGRVDFGDVTTHRAIPAEAAGATPRDTPPDDPGAAPAGAGPSSWRTAAVGATSWHAGYEADGAGVLSALFPDAAETLTLSDLAFIRYATRRPAGSPDGVDWRVALTTRPE